MDQKLNEGPRINFLGKPASTASFIAELALRMELDIVPIRLSRNKNLETIITFFDKIKLPYKKLSHRKKVEFILTEVNNIIGSWIYRRPDEWLWIHRRWDKNLY